jgi:homocysteine S-methyltransferase
VSHGESVADCAALVAAFPQTVAIGVNCVPPVDSFADWRIAQGSTSRLLVYPNSGEGWDAERRCWTGNTDPAEFGTQAAEWFRAGAQIVGGCCRTRPAHAVRANVTESTSLRQFIENVNSQPMEFVLSRLPAKIAESCFTPAAARLAFARSE